MVLNPVGSISTISPGLKSRILSMPICSKAIDSEATAQPTFSSPKNLPKVRGLIPKISLAAKSTPGVSKTKLKGPLTF